MSSHIALFNDERFHRLNAGPAERLFRYDHHAGGQLVGTLAGVICGEVLECGHSAPFGGIDFTQQGVLAGTVVDLLRGACRQAAAEGVRAMLFRARPAYYGEDETVAAFALFGLGATARKCELSLGLETWRWHAVEDYEAKLKSSARRILRRGLGAGLSLAAAVGAEEWTACYELLTETRRRRGARLSISLDYLMRARDVFGGRIVMYRLCRGADLAGAALVYRVTTDCDYVVAWGDDLRYRPQGAINVIAYQVVRNAITAGIRLVDLGIASVGGVPDDGLIQFKRNVGAATGLRLDLQLKFG